MRAEGVEGKFPNLVGRRKTRDLLKRDKNFSKQLLEGKISKKIKALTFGFDGGGRLQSGVVGGERKKKSYGPREGG